LLKIAAASSAGLDWIQLREKDLSARDFASLTREVLRRASASPTRILVNDRLDVALSERAAGVHLAENSLPLAQARRLVSAHPQAEHFASAPSQSPVAQAFRPEAFLIGVSCHSLESAISAARDGADYLFFGPVFATPSKAAFGAPQGLDRLAAVCRAVTVPVLAIGGITLANAASCLDAGASGLAAIRLFQDAPDLPALVRSLRASLL